MHFFGFALSSLSPPAIATALANSTGSVITYSPGLSTAPMTLIFASASGIYSVSPGASMASTLSDVGDVKSMEMRPSLVMISALLKSVKSALEPPASFNA